VIDVIGNRDLMEAKVQGLRKAGCDYFYSVYGQIPFRKVIVLRVLWRGSKWLRVYDRVASGFRKTR
jgi:hypothetical protein